MPAKYALIGNYSTESSSGFVAAVALTDEGLLGEEISRIPLSNPSFLAVHDGQVLVTQEDEQSSLVRLNNHDGMLTLAAPPTDSLGSIAAHVSTIGDTAAVSHYGDGALTLLDVSGPETPVIERIQLLGSGPVSPDQDGPRAHYALPTGDDFMVTNLGADQMALVGPGPDGWSVTDEVDFPAGSGPRHVVQLGNKFLVSGELDSRLHVVGDAGDGLEYLGSQPSTEKPGVKSVPSHLALDEAGRFLYFANRFRDTIAVFDCADLAADGLPELVGEFSCGGEIPRFFAVADGKIYVANQASNTIDVFALRPFTGYLGDKLQSVPWQAPAVIVLV